MSTQSQSNTQTRGALNININVRPQENYLSINGVVYKVPEGVSQMEFVRELRSGQ